MTDYLTITMVRPFYPPGKRCGDCLHLRYLPKGQGYKCQLEERSGYTTDKLCPLTDANGCKEFLVD